MELRLDSHYFLALRHFLASKSKCFFIAVSSGIVAWRDEFVGWSPCDNSVEGTRNLEVESICIYRLLSQNTNVLLHTPVSLLLFISPHKAWELIYAYENL